jgi:hypothetical protein
MAPRELFYFLPGTIQHSRIIVLSGMLSSSPTRYMISCGACRAAFVLPQTVGMSWDASGACSTVKSIRCMHCNQWHVWLHQGVACNVVELFCPSCGCLLEEPPRYGWAMCAICQWEGRLSEALPTPPEEPMLPAAA